MTQQIYMIVFTGICPDAMDNMKMHILLDFFQFHFGLFISNLIILLCL